jgi:hypothetical protein
MQISTLFGLLEVARERERLLLNGREKESASMIVVRESDSHFFFPLAERLVTLLLVLHALYKNAV